MYKYIFTGKIHPQRVDFTVEPDLSFIMKHDDFGIDGQVDLKVSHSLFSTELKSKIDYTHINSCGLLTLKNFIEDNVRMVVDVYCYINSYSYDVEVTKVICDELGVDETFGVQGEINIRKTKDEITEEFAKLLGLFDSPVRMFLKDIFADFRRAIKYPATTASFCFRAIETLRMHVFEDPNEVDAEKRKTDGWIKLRSKLGMERKDFKKIEGFAVPNRHGEYPKISGLERQEIMNFTRSIIDKALHFVENANRVV